MNRAGEGRQGVKRIRCVGPGQPTQREVVWCGRSQFLVGTRTVLVTCGWRATVGCGIVFRDLSSMTECDAEHSSYSTRPMTRHVCEADAPI